MTDPRTRPVILTADEVRGALDGSRTQVRRVMKEQPPEGYPLPYVVACSNTPKDEGSWVWLDDEPPFSNIGHRARCPFGAPGDRLWVRETYVLECSQAVGWYEPPFSDGRPLLDHEDGAWGRWWEQPHYRATDPCPELAYGEDGDPGVRWRSSTSMPRWASRLTLEVTDVRAQQVQKISEDGANAQGFAAHWQRQLREAGAGGPLGRPHRVGWFASEWDAIHGAGAWERNDWVWAVSHKVVA